MLWGILVCMALAAAPAPQPVAVLGFELRDLSTEAGTPEERARAATLQPLLEEALAATGELVPVPVAPAAQRQANAGFGYLFDHPDEAAALGRGVGARWVVVGRVHKPSFLFVYLLARVVDTRSGAVVSEPVVEVKGAGEALTRRGVARLARQIGEAIHRVAPATGVPTE